MIAPTAGELASGLIGQGRLEEPENIRDLLIAHFQEYLPLKGKKALVTAGPTYEAIDPVRFIGNHSSGKMGYALAARLQTLGAEVTLVSGPTALTPDAGIVRVAVTSAQQMLDACALHFEAADIIVMSAAVADYTPQTVATEKIKKKDAEFVIPLKKTTDILATLGATKQAHQTLLGFALETNNELAHALDKLKRKNLDFIVLNSMQDAGAGFAVDTNKITLINRQGEQHEYPLKSKVKVAVDICDQIIAHQHTHNAQ